MLRGEGDPGAPDKAGFRKDLADTVRELRKEHHLSQEQLAARLGKGKMQVFRLEHCDTPTTLGTIEELAAAFDVPLAALLARVLEKSMDQHVTLEAEALEATTTRVRKDVERWTAEVSEHLSRIQRPCARHLLEAVAMAIGYMSDDQMHYEALRWAVWAQYKERIVRKKLDTEAAVAERDLLKVFPRVRERENGETS